MEFKVVINERSYSLQEIQRIMKKEPRDYDVFELMKKTEKELAQMLRNDLNIEYAKSWKVNEKILVLLFGHEGGKCNAIRTHADSGRFIGLCKGKPSYNDKNLTNGRCHKHNGNVKKTSKRGKPGREKGDPKLKDNKNAVTTGTGIRARQELNKEFKALAKTIDKLEQVNELFNRKENEVDNLIYRYDIEIARQTLIIQNLENIGMNITNDISYSKAIEVLDKLLESKRKLIEIKESKLKDNNKGKGNSVTINFNNSTSNANDMFSVDEEFLPNEEGEDDDD